MKIPRIKKSPSKFELLDALKSLAGEWFGINDMPFEMEKSSFEKRVTSMVGDLGEKKRERGKHHNTVHVYFFIPVENIVSLEIEVLNPSNKLTAPKQKITPYKLKTEDKLFNLMMGA